MGVSNNQVNVWGRAGAGGMTAQRGDLWTLDFSLAYAGLQSQGVLGSTNSLGTAPPVANMVYFAQTVDFPVVGINLVSIPRGSTPFNMPGYDEPYGPIRIAFVHGANAYDGSIYGFFKAWMLTARAWRENFYDSDGTPDPDPNNLVVSTSSFDFRWPVTIKFYSGLLNSLSYVTEGSSAPPMPASSQYLARNCWCKSLQLPSMAQTNGNGFVTVMVELIPESIDEDGANEVAQVGQTLLPASTTNDGLQG